MAVVSARVSLAVFLCVLHIHFVDIAIINKLNDDDEWQSFYFVITCIYSWSGDDDGYMSDVLRQRIPSGLDFAFQLHWPYCEKTTQGVHSCIVSVKRSTSSLYRRPHNRVYAI